MMSNRVQQNLIDSHLVWEPEEFPAFCVLAELLIDSVGNLNADLLMELLSRLETGLESIASSMDATSPSVREKAQQKLRESAQTAMLHCTILQLFANYNDHGGHIRAPMFLPRYAELSLFLKAQR